MKTYMTDRSKDGGWYTPYQQDMDDIKRRKSNRSSSKTKAGWIIAWFLLLGVLW